MLDPSRTSLPPHPTIQHVAVFRALQLGDMLCAVPSLRAIRQLFPSAEITLISLPWAATFARRFAHLVDRFIAFPGHPQLPERDYDAHVASSFYSEVRAYAYDIAIQLHGSGGIVNPLVAEFGAQTTVVFYEDDRTIPEGALGVRYRSDLSESQRLLELPKALAQKYGIEIDTSLDLEFPILEDEMHKVLMMKSRLGIPRNYICLHPGARDLSRRAAATHFVNTLRSVQQRVGDLPVVITGSSFEMDAVGALTAALRVSGFEHPIFDTAELDLSLGELAALIAGAQHLITNDTGASHLAAALKVPSTIFFSNSDPGRWAPEDRVRHTVIDLRHQTKPLLTASYA